MRSILLLLLFVITVHETTHAQQLKDLLRGKDADSTKPKQEGKKWLEAVNTISGGQPNTTEVVNGLKEALTIGTGRSVEKLAALDGFFGNAAIKILLPPEAKNAEKTLKALGMGQLLDNTILTINRAAEDAAQSAGTIFTDAIRKMTLQDAWGILNGTDSAATSYLRINTTPALTAAMSPVIAKSLEKTGATKYWNEFFGQYNRFAARRIQPDLVSYVTEKAMAGIFFQLAKEEQLIRKDPVARSSALLKKVFANPKDNR